MHLCDLCWFVAVVIPCIHIFLWRTTKKLKGKVKNQGLEIDNL